jgi:hypothetical protein
MTQGSLTPRIAGVLSLWLALVIAASAQAQSASGGDAAPPTGAAANGQAGLQKVDAPDGSASARLPPGWHLIKSGQMVIDAAGPNGETASLGNTAIARDPGGPPAAAKLGGVDMVMPYATPLPEKFLRLVKHADPADQLTIINSTELKVGRQLGQCARIVGDLATKDGPKKFESLFCSLPPDVAGIYKNLFRLVTVPARLARQERPMLEAILTSYRLPQQMLQRMLAPVVGPPAGGGGPAAPGRGPGAPGGGPSGPGGPGGGSPSTSQFQAKAAAQTNAEVQLQIEGATRSAEGVDNLLRE